ncbi:hypothetical protein [Methylobacterium platani]|uniref:Pectate lyase superfamily protein domain-containing protein n=2 Tax=Methylobacterium platani TaxID=427683 RepID=A0A179RWQ4_9HYPH|nr:hypothetical protein [Methylobacterium platani]KMO16252.1 hypothetical protein SQ03_15060 [Methylobacterium platani JCM 14648]OAS13312.1 hypothetical protein A5481_31115 [Methylobacterium platani]
MLTRTLSRIAVALALALPAPALAQGQAPLVPVPNRSANDNSAAPANTRYVDSAAQALRDAIQARAPIANPTFSGTVTVPGTVAAGTLLGDGSGAGVTATGAAAAQTLGGWFSSVVFGTPTVTALRAFNRLFVAPRTVMYVSGHAAPGDGGGGPFIWAAASTLPDDGGTIINPTGNTGAGRWLRLDVTRIWVSYFGAQCDGKADDTSAFQAAFAAAVNRLRPVEVPAGTCLVSGLSYTVGSYAGQFAIRGAGRNLTRIRQISDAAAAPVLTIGSPTAKILTANIEIRGITFDGNNRRQPAVVSYDLVRSFVWDVLFTGGSAGYVSYGGIGNTIYADALDNDVGGRIVPFASLAGGGWPNHIRWSGALAHNARWGLDVDGGRNLVCDTCDIEANGTKLGEATGGVRVGPAMGAEVAGVGSATASPGLTLRSPWFERNAGEADVVLQSGRNLIDSGVFSSPADMATHDIHAVGGVYTVTNSRAQFPKTANIRDEAGVEPGSVVDGGAFPSLDVSRATHVRTAGVEYVSVPFSAGNGLQVAGGTFRVLSPSTPASATAPCAAGTMTWDAGYAYVCVATNTWKRSPLATW